MTIDRFTLARFTSVLEELYPDRVEKAGIDKGEYCFRVFPTEVPNRLACIWIRSSIGYDKVADDAGEDSIRLSWQSMTGKFLAKSETWTNRVAGWEKRLKGKIDTLIEKRLSAGDCPTCGAPMFMAVSQTKTNPGREFANCSIDKEHKSFRWLDKGTVGVVFAKDLLFTASRKTVVEEVDNEPLDNGTRFEEQPLLVERVIKPEADDDFPDFFPPAPLPPPASETVRVFSGFDGMDDLDDNAVEVDLSVPNLTDEQAAFVYAPLAGACRVMATAGAGKTFAIKYRYQYLVQQGIRPENILVVTFGKEMAATALKKIMSVVPDLSETAQGQICTIHAFCLRFLTDFYSGNGNGNNWRGRQMAKDWQLKKVFEETMARLIPDIEGRPAFDETMSWIQHSMAHGVPPALALGFFKGHFEDNFWPGILAETRQAIDGWLEKNSLFTFPYQVYSFEQRMKLDKIFMQYVQARITDVIVDEGQDTSAQAMRILRTTVSHTGNFSVIGDIDQMMYRFAGATPEANLLDGFERSYPDGRTYFLSTNFRSTHTIVNNSLKLIRHNYDHFGGPYPQELMKPIKAATTAPEGAETVFVEYDDALQEARNVAAQIKDLVANGYQPDDIFVGMRTRAQSAYLEMTMSVLQPPIPYINLSGVSFWDLPHIRRLISYLTLAVDGNDKAAFEAVYNVSSVWFSTRIGTKDVYIPHRYLGKEFLSASEGTMTGMSRLSNKRHPLYKWSWAKGAEDFGNFVLELSSMLNANCPLPEVLEYIVEKSLKPAILYEIGSEGSGGDTSILEDMATVIEAARPYRSATEFVEYVKKMVALAKANQSKDWTGKVVLSTIHKLKGQERRIVFGIGLCENEEENMGLLPHTGAMREPKATGKLPVGGKGRIEDERCIFFVLTTRAKERNFLSSIKTHRNLPMFPSRFVREMMGE